MREISLILNSQQKAEILNTHFVEKAKLPENLPSLPKDNPPVNVEIFNFINVNELEVQNVLTKLDINKANGPDNISQKLLKETSKSVAEPLTKLFNLSLSTGKFPESWKIANVSPIYKKNNL